MDLTARYVADSRQAIADVEVVDVTSPDVPRAIVARLVTRLTEQLRTMSDHAERIGQDNVRLRTEAGEFETQVRAMHEALAAAAA